MQFHFALPSGDDDDRLVTTRRPNRLPKRSMSMLLNFSPQEDASRYPEGPVAGLRSQPTRRCFTGTQMLPSHATTVCSGQQKARTRRAIVAVFGSKGKIRGLLGGQNRLQFLRMPVPALFHALRVSSVDQIRKNNQLHHASGKHPYSAVTTVTPANPDGDRGVPSRAAKAAGERGYPRRPNRRRAACCCERCS